MEEAANLSLSLFYPFLRLPPEETGGALVVGSTTRGRLTVLVLAYRGVPNYLKLVCLLGSN